MGTKRQQGSALLISCIIVAAVALVGCFYFQNVLADIFLLTGAAVLWILFFRQQKKGENVRELLYRELMFDALSNNVDDIFVMLDSETWQVDYISPNVERLLGFPQADVKANICLLGEGTTDGQTPVTREELAAIPTHSCRRWYRERLHNHTGEHRWYRETVYREELQGRSKLVIVMSDRTQERKMNQNLQDALEAAKSANEAKSHFLANMSHDIRTPMNAIIGFTALMEREVDHPEKVREYTRKISASGQHLLSLINDVLDMSKIESGKTSLNTVQFSLPELLEELYTILRPQTNAKKQHLEFHVQGCPPEQLMGDKLRLNQILLNLLSNAVKYTPEGGDIRFVVQSLPQTASQYVRLCFAVKDNGIGMSPEFVKTIFDPFSRELTSTSSGIQGTGLGMAITKNLVELMGGVIQVDSQLGEGSVFTVELIFALPPQHDSKGQWTLEGITRVLTVDDEEEVCKDIQAMMAGTGVEVCYTTQGDQAVELAVQAQARGEEFQAILLDWRMPGHSGVEIARQLRERIRPEVPILVLTSYEWSDIEEEARAAGIDAFLPKPFFVSTFQQVLEDLLAANSGKQPGEMDNEDALRGLYFLVAEDNELNAEILTEMLDMEGAKCQVAPNGQEALELFRQSQPGDYDMILMDVQMPVMDGYEATRRIRACGHPMAERIPIVAMTANAFAEDVRNALNAGMNGHLSKPIDMDAMKDLLGQLRAACPEPHHPGMEQEQETEKE